MKSLIKIPIFVYCSIAGTQFLINSFNFGADYYKNLSTLVVAFSIFYLLKSPILKILTFPLGCLGTGLLSLVLICALLFGLTTILPDFSLNIINRLNLINTEIMLPFSGYGLAGSLVITSITLSLIYSLLEWLFSCHK